MNSAATDSQSPLGTPRLLRTITGKRLHHLVADRTGDKDLAHDVAVVSQVLPFKVSPYVIENLIDWGRAPDDPMYRLTMPHRDMLRPEDFSRVEGALAENRPEHLQRVVDSVRETLNPHPSDQLTRNIPDEGELDHWGLQHKYTRTLLVFPRQAQTCHAYCGYCFRWAQFVGKPELQQAVPGPAAMLDYLDAHPEVTDVLLTGGDPLVMTTKLLADYIEPLLEPHRSHISSIRIGTKALAFSPDRITGRDSDSLLRLLEKCTSAGRHVAIMAHMTHPIELSTTHAQSAIRRLLSTGAALRSQAPVVRHVNDSPDTWAALWHEQVRLGVSPYYMFVERDTGARRYYGLALTEALSIYQRAIRSVSGIARTARGPVMSASPGKVVVDGVVDLDRGPAFALRFLQARDSALVGNPFFAHYDDHVQWWDELKPYTEMSSRHFEQA